MWKYYEHKPSSPQIYHQAYEFNRFTGGIENTLRETKASKHYIQNTKEIRCIKTLKKHQIMLKIRINLSLYLPISSCSVINVANANAIPPCGSTAAIHINRFVIFYSIPTQSRHKDPL